MAEEQNAPVVEALVPATAGDEALPLCDKCKTPMELSDMAAKKTVHAKQSFCKSCHSLTNLLQKHIDTKELFSSMTPSEITEFYQKGLTERKAAGGVLQYKVVRSTLLRQITKRVIETSKTEAGGTYQPLSWWAKQGYDAARVEKHGVQMSHECFGTVYRVDLVTVSESHATEQAEQTLVELEQRVSRKRTAKEIEDAQKSKRPKGKGKGKLKGKEDADDVAEPEKELSAEDKVLIDLVDLECDDVEIVPHLRLVSFFLLYIYIDIYFVFFSRSGVKRYILRYMSIYFLIILLACR